tara:strand:+ start:89 stop:517 length:429 start_codon:yes stop_codon:yes gene_type:complete
MKNVTFRLTDKQHYYLTELAKQEKRSIEHLVWMLIPQGVRQTFDEQTYYLKKLQCDFNEEDAKHQYSTPSWGGEYYGSHDWADEIGDNVLADIEGTLESSDASLDLTAEIERTAALCAERTAALKAKQDENRAKAQSEPEGD